MDGKRETWMEAEGKREDDKQYFGDWGYWARDPSRSTVTQSN